MDLIHSDAFTQRVQALQKEWHVPSVSVATFDQHDITAKAFGLASLEPSTAATTETLYDIASTTKSITAACIGHLVGDGPFTWTTPVASILGDDWALVDETATKITTLEDILCHRSGMPRHDLSYLGVTARVPDTPRSVTLNLRNLPLTAAPRTKWQYCNMMYTVAAHIVEKTSGQSYEQFLKDRVLDKLDMQSTYVQPSGVVKAGQSHRFSTPYLWRKQLERYDAAERRDMPEGQGAGLLQSTPADYARWVQAVMTKNPALLDEAIYEQLIKPRIIVDPGSTDEDLPPATSPQMYALGWEMEFYRGVRIVRHDGAEVGYGSIMMFVPKFQFGVVIMGNSSGAGDVAYLLAMELTDSVLDVPERDKAEAKAQRQRLAKKEAEDDDEEEKKLREELLKEDTDDHNAPLMVPIPLTSYTGTYSNPGYHEVTLDIKNRQLHLDATDRGFPFTVTFEQVGHSGRRFIGHLVDDEFDGSYKRVEFEVDADGEVQVKSVGIDLCSQMKPDLVWFARCA
ncbi:hypothetical protein LTR10_015278 [Elasticomyces elasticus]|uniref:Beta-lactamase-related domain-containing protein n=1 Tax=Exophiala sideris TaxID=1016849 RepID=A0ABR0JEA7_9EURO|nr:hypothetical protein LTR10_015278 [Elasticomyces elasticus]KAK5032753.1 hypothetical protein LTS07_004163 [Exophiala sideris]KAK5037066.1 hypothetical protein LTR13_004871 [Exophiala sideris]KAK5062277.1 hypothetical protein LTR69_004635 [Exophiala sideris]KAK5182224.1 hypothetical protein LTR44_005235 [Eurotiomycetes sp. CCFEE 6388]